MSQVWPWPVTVRLSHWQATGAIGSQQASRILINRTHPTRTTKSHPCGLPVYIPTIVNQQLQTGAVPSCSSGVEGRGAVLFGENVGWMEREPMPIRPIVGDCNCLK